MTKDETAIRNIIADQAKALYAKNADLLFAHHAAEFFSYDLDPPLLHRDSAPGAKAGTEAWFATWKGPIGWDARDVAVTVGGDVAFTTSLVHLTGTKTDGAEQSVWFRNTSGYRKENGEWKIVHSHSSVPFYMDGSVKAAVDLRP